MIIFSMQQLLKKHSANILLLVLLALAGVGCSTKKNTWATRTYQAVNTRFNVYFNGYTSYNEGLKNILKSNKEDYSTVIPMYPISRHSNATAAKSDMDRTIEKCRKAIKLHSIKVKPAKDYKKMSNPDYKLFYNQEEFNPALSEAWLLLGKAEFHKGDFLGASGTFAYIARHYSTDKDMVAVCQLWMARAYGEMGWIYEAEQILLKLDQDDLKRSNIGLFAAVNADLLLKKRQYKEAIPFLKLALEKEDDNEMRKRFGFLLAQLCQKNGDSQAAYKEYSNVIKLNPPYEMDFNARINRAQLNTESVSKVRKELLAMLKNKNNKDYRDQLFYALGNTYLNQGDTLPAIENYKLSADTSTRKGVEKAVTLITLADIYYKQRNYAKAQPCYDEASKIITKEHGDYARVARRAETLSELVTQSDIVVLQDSLQRLARLSESERVEAVNRVIERIEKEEKLAAEKALKENEARSRRGPEDEPGASLPIGVTSPGGWYFYNPEIIRSGASDFNRKWGNRKLEDNWRRQNKSASLFGEENVAGSADAASTSTVDTTANAKSAEVADNKKPEFYLRQIPLTSAQLDKSNADIASALLAMGEIYKEKIEDYPMAVKTFQEFIRRFGSDKRVPDAYFNLYMIGMKQDNPAEAETYRAKLVNDFPDTKYSKILAQPDYAERLERMYREQDSIYTLTYRAYSRSDYQTVFANAAYIQKNYPLATLMPKFAFLSALSIGKCDSQEKFRTALSELVTNYPGSDVSAMAKDILALMKQGQEAKQGTTGGTLLARREEKAPVEKAEVKEISFSAEKQARHRLMLITPTTQENLNKLQYSVASYNFSRFMIKDFDLVINRLDTARSILSVTNFESYDEVAWYLNSILSDPSLGQMFNEFKVQKVIISDENFGLLRTKYSLDDYLAFLSKPLGAVKQEQVAQSKSTKQTESLKKETTVARKESAVMVKQEIKKEEKTVEQAVGKADEKSLANAEVKKTESKALEVKTSEKQPDKTVSKTSVEAVKQAETKSEKQTAQSAKQTTAAKQETVKQAAVETKQEEVPLFKGLFGYRANEPHYIALYVLSGAVDFEKVKTAFDVYNKQNYGLMNLKVSLEKVDKLQIIIIGSLPDAAVAKSYLLRMVKERSLFDGLKGANYRNLVGSQKNLDTMVQKNALETYIEFMKEYYLK